MKFGNTLNSEIASLENAGSFRKRIQSVALK
jgi:hypothetical protein